MNFAIYKTLSDKERLFADLLLEIIAHLKPEEVTQEELFGPLKGIDDLDKLNEIAENDSGREFRVSGQCLHNIPIGQHCKECSR